MTVGILPRKPGALAPLVMSALALGLVGVVAAVGTILWLEW